MGPEYEIGDETRKALESCERCNNLGSAILEWLQEDSDFGIIIVDTSLRITCINRWVEDLIQELGKELTGKGIFEVFPELMERNIHRFIEEAREGKSYILSYGLHKYVIRPRNQKSIYQKGLITPLSIDGQVVAVLLKIEDVTERVLKERELRETIQELQKALAEVKTLKGLLPICANCKKIRNDKGYWEQVETYIMEHTDATFTHGICPDCMKELYPDLYESIKAKQEREDRDEDLGSR